MALFLGVNPSTYSMAESPNNNRRLSSAASIKMTEIVGAVSSNKKLPPNEKYREQIIKKQQNEKHRLYKLIKTTTHLLAKAVYEKERMVEKFETHMKQLNGIATLRTLNSLTDKNKKYLNIVEALVLKKLRACDVIEQGILQTEIDCLALSLEKYKGLKQMAVQ